MRAQLFFRPRDFLPPFFPPLRLADFPAFAIFAARVLDIPLRFSALYFFLFLIEFPAMRSSPFGLV
jgi:hypothetical protein